MEVMSSVLRLAALSLGVALASSAVASEETQLVESINAYRSQAQPCAGQASMELPPLKPEAIARAADILKATRQALGGEKLAAVKTLVASGRSKRVRGNNLVPIEFEIDLELPDKYLRKDESPAEETDPTKRSVRTVGPTFLPVR